MTQSGAWSLAPKLLHTATDILATTELQFGPRGAAEVNVLAVTLLARTISNMRGVITLLQVGLVVEARVLTRCCIENELWIAGLVSEGDKFVDRMMHDELKSRQMRGEALFASSGRDTLSADDRGKKLRDWLRETKAAHPDAHMLVPKQVAKTTTSIGDVYILYSQLSSDAAHPSVAALNRHIVPSDDSDHPEMRGLDVLPPPRPEEIDDTLELACMALLGACVGTSQLLGGTPGGEVLNALADEYLALSRQGAQGQSVG